MTARILEGKVFAQAFREDAQKKAAALQEKYGVQPGLAVIIVGSNPASQVYVRNKHKSCEALGIYSEVIEMPETTTKDELIAKIDALNADAKIHGILVQLPLPEQIAAHESEILERIRPEKDVDGFHPVNVGRLVTGEPGLVPCTPFGCLRMLELAGIRDILTKSLGSANPNNMVRATMEGLKSLKKAEDVAALRGKTVAEILG